MTDFTRDDVGYLIEKFFVEQEDDWEGEFTRDHWQRLLTESERESRRVFGERLVTYLQNNRVVVFQ